MSRSGYSDDIDHWKLIRWRGQVASALRGARGQKFLRELIAALDALPEKKLVASNFKCEDGVCAFGAVAAARKIDTTRLQRLAELEDDHQLPKAVSSAFDVAEALAAEVMHINDEDRWPSDHKDDARRWARMRAWAEEHLIEWEPATQATAGDLSGS